MIDQIIIYIRQHIESAINLIAGFFGMCCGNVTVLQCSNAAGLIANVGGAFLVIVQVCRMMRRKSRQSDKND